MSGTPTTAYSPVHNIRRILDFSDDAEESQGPGNEGSPIQDLEIVETFKPNSSGKTYGSGTPFPVSIKRNQNQANSSGGNYWNGNESQGSQNSSTDSGSFDGEKCYTVVV
jgi:hypothetical protein